MARDYSKTQFNKYIRVESALYSLYRQAKTFQMSLDELLKIKEEKINNHPDKKGLTSYYIGKLRGIDDCLFSQIQTEWTEWKMYYTNKVGRVVYTKKWEKIPEYIKDNGKFNGNHFWKMTDLQKKRKEDPKPFGNQPSIGAGRK